jgi:asparagine synthase (glutamine-hydrolysing)
MRPDAAMYEFLDRTTVQSLVDDHLQGRVNRRLLIWSLLNFENWCRTFLAGEVPQESPAPTTTARAADAG